MFFYLKLEYWLRHWKYWDAKKRTILLPKFSKSAEMTEHLPARHVLKDHVQVTIVLKYVEMHVNWPNICGNACKLTKSYEIQTFIEGVREIKNFLFGFHFSISLVPWNDILNWLKRGNWWPVGFSSRSVCAPLALTSPPAQIWKSNILIL